MLFGISRCVLVDARHAHDGVGLVAVFPLLSAASYAAWKDVFDVRARQR